MRKNRMKKILAMALITTTSIYSAHYNKIRQLQKNLLWAVCHSNLPRQTSKIYTARINYLLEPTIKTSNGSSLSDLYLRKNYEIIFLEDARIILQNIAQKNGLSPIKSDKNFSDQEIQPLNKLAKKYANIMVNRKLTVEQVYCDVKEVYKEQGKTIAALLQMQKHQESTPISNKEINICNVEWDDCGFFFDVRDSSGAKIDLKK